MLILEIYLRFIWIQTYRSFYFSRRLFTGSCLLLPWQGSTLRPVGSPMRLVFIQWWLTFHACTPDELRDDLETSRRCTIERNVKGAKEIVFECEKKFELSFIDQRVNYLMSRWERMLHLSQEKGIWRTALLLKPMPTVCTGCPKSSFPYFHAL